MKIQYKFVNETISIDVPDDWGEILIDLDRQEYNNDHKETRRHYSLEGKVYEGMDYAVEDSGLEALFAGPTDEERLHAAIRQLSHDQQEMVRAIYFENVSVNDYAARMLSYSCPRSLGVSVTRKSAIMWLPASTAVWTL